MRELILIGAERDWLATMSADIPWDRLIFSTKESVFKAWWLLARAPLDFSEAKINVRPDDQIFHAKLAPKSSALLEPSIVEFAGRFLVQDGLILTAIALSPMQTFPARRRP